METFFGPWNLGKLISDTFNIYFKNWIYFIGVVILFAIVNALIGWSMLTASGGRLVLPGVYWPNAWTWIGFFKAIGFGTLYLLIATIVNALMANVLIYSIGRQYFEDKLSFSKAINAGLKKIVVVILVGLLRGIVIFVLVLTIIGIPLAIYFAIKWLFATHVILFEGKSVSESLSRSSDLAKNNWWRILVYIIIIAIIVGIISAIFSWIEIGEFELGTLIASIITLPITAISTTLIYFTLRVEKEQYNVDRLRIDMATWDTTYAQPVYPAETTVAPAAPEAGADTMYCPSCGELTSTKATFCSSCGKPLNLDTAPKPKDDTPESDGPFIK